MGQARPAVTTLVSTQIRRGVAGRHGRELAKRVAVTAAPLWDPLYLIWSRHRQHWAGPVPPFANRRRVAAWRLPYYLTGGKDCRDDLATRIERYLPDRPFADLDVLDLAAGPGRIAQHFAGQFGSLTACDVDPSAIEYVRRRLEGIQAVVNQSQPPLPLEDDSFDVIYCWSLLTHLPEPLQSAYLAEIRRILRPGGYALITTNGHHFLDTYRNYPGAEQWWLQVTHDDLRSAGMLYHEYAFVGHDTTNALQGITGSFGLAMHDPAHIETTWKGQLDVDAVEAGAMSNGQDLVVLRKP